MSPNSVDPTFLISAERSGSSLLRLMLDHHPEIAFATEFGWAVAKIGDDGSLPDVVAFAEWLRRQRGFDYDIDVRLDYRALVADILLQKRQRSGGKQFVGGTIHHAFHRVPYLWPRARFVHLVRDPRDVARSVLQKGWAGNLYDAAGWWVAAESSWDRLVPQLQADQFVEVRFEDLVAQPVECLERICSLIGTTFSEEMLTYSSSAKQYPKPDKGLAFQWKNAMKDRDIRLVEARTGTLLATRPYDLVHDDARPKGAFAHRLLLLQARLLRLPGRIEKFGLWPVIGNMVGRKLRFRWLERRTQEQIDRTTLRHLAEEAAGGRAPSSNLEPWRSRS